MTLVLVNKKEIVMVEPTQEELEIDYQRQEFEAEWQNAYTREEITNFIIRGVAADYEKGNYINFANYDIKNQARIFGDLNYVREQERKLAEMQES